MQWPRLTAPAPASPPHFPAPQKQLEELVSGQAQRDQAALDEQARRQGQTEEAAMAKALKKAKVRRPCSCTLMKSV